MDKIVDHLFVFRGEGYIEDFPGNYSDFRAYEDSQDQEQEPIKPKSIQQQSTPKLAAGVQKQKLSFNEQKEYQQLESKIRSLEKDKVVLEQSFFEEGLSIETIEERSKKLQEIIETIELKTMRWFELAAKIEG